MGGYGFVSDLILSLQCCSLVRGRVCVLIFSYCGITRDGTSTEYCGGFLVIMVLLEVVCTLETNCHLRLVFKPRKKKTNRFHNFYLSLSISYRCEDRRRR